MPTNIADAYHQMMTAGTQGGRASMHLAADNIGFFEKDIKPDQRGAGVLAHATG